MDSALKQRLIGAAVLIALAVIFLPMLVDGPEPERGTSAVPLDIPAPPERDFETRELPLALPPSPGAASAPGAIAPAAEDPDRVVTVDVVATPRVDALPEELAAAPGAASATPPPAAAAPAPAASTAATPSATSIPAATSSGRYAVNLGSYGNTANASALVAALKAAGLPAHADPIALDGKTVQRVRLGPYAQRGEAEAGRLAATRLRSDLAASVVALDGETEATPRALARTPASGGFAVQLGALKSEADANALRERARSAGFTAFVERVTTEAGALWRVRVGPELQRARADQLKASISAKLGIDGVVVAHP
jgi:DedD protein